MMKMTNFRLFQWLLGKAGVRRKTPLQEMKEALKPERPRPAPRPFERATQARS